jgi:hypothetical protein
LNEAEVSKKLKAGEKLSKTYFLFEHGTTLNEKSMELAKRSGIPSSYQSTSITTPESPTHGRRTC